MQMIDSTRTPDRSIGALRVRPASREVFNGDRSELVEPRVLQVLLALADAAGEVVTRDELIARCWDNRVVSEDAINRAVAKVRQLGAGIGAGSFTVETIIKSGFRLHVQDVPKPPDDGVMPEQSTRSRTNVRRTMVAVALAGIAAVVWPFLQPRTGPDQVTAARDLHQRGLAAVFEGTAAQSEQGIGYLREATALDPDDAQVWGSLAMAHVLSLRHLPPHATPAVVARVREAAARGLALDPREGRSAAALVSLLPTFGHWPSKDQALRDALAGATPGSAPLIFQRIQFLANVGRLREAHALSGEVAATAPLLPWIQAARIDLLSATGRPEEALRTAERAGELWPRDREVWFARLYAYLANGRPELAQALIAQRSRWPLATSADEMQRLQMLAVALDTRMGADEVLAAYAAVAPTQANADQAIRAAALLGRPDAGLVMAKRFYMSTGQQSSDGVVFRRIGLSTPAERSTAALFVAPAATLWRDPAFWALADAMGLLAFWQATGAPDLCSNPQLLPECRRHGLAG
jgi:DNA-binding winged helix-turn-helix (wHTH) protein/tetratricopeptide (TPR) repeat protein